MRRACSREVRVARVLGSLVLQCSPGSRTVKPALRDQLARRRPGRARRAALRRRRERGRPSRRPDSARSRRRRRARAGRAARARRRARSRGKPGRVATASRVRSSTSSGSLQREKAAELVGADTKTRIVEALGAQQLDGARDTGRAGRRRPGRRALREREAILGGRVDLAMGRALAHEDRRAARRRSARSPRRRRRRARDAAGRTRRRRGLLPLEHLLPQLDLVARPRARGAEDRLELVLGRRRARDAEAALGAEDAECADAPAAAGRRGSRPSRPRARRRPASTSWRSELEERARAARRDPRRSPRRRAGRARIRSSSTPNAGGSGRRSILFRTTICGRSSRPAPYAASSASIVRQRSSASSSDGVDDVHEHPRALEMREELVAEPDALARALDQPGHVGDDELPPVGGLDRPEHRRERRERILGDLRPRVRDPRQERRLAGVREPDERGVGEELEAKLDLPFLARPGRPRRSAASGGSGRRSACCRGRRCRPSPTTTRAPGRARSATSSSPSNTCVPTGTGSTASSPRAPFDSPGRRRLPPRPARSFWFGRKPERSRRRGSATSTTSPPSPPSPPSGPPRGTYFSRRKWIEPSPPRPAMTVSVLDRGTSGTVLGSNSLLLGGPGLSR